MLISSQELFAVPLLMFVVFMLIPGPAGDSVAIVFIDRVSNIICIIKRLEPGGFREFQNCTTGSNQSI